MALELSELKFSANTTELEKASQVIGTLVQNVGKLDKASKDVARTEAALAKAAKDNATANLTTAKAQEVTAKATEKTNSILQRQTDIYDFMTQGFSKGQSRTLATAKATGQLSDELKRVLEDMKAFSNDSFDKSELGLKRLQKTMKETVAAQGYFNEGSNLTTKQARELSNDLDRIGVSLTKQGKSYQEVTQAQALHKQEFIEEAAAVNRAQNALDVVTKQRKEVVTATNYLTQADQKMAAALNVSNASLDRAGTDSLVKYESALRKSGLAQDVVTQKLSTYKVQLAQVQAQEMKRREQHLARASAPQLTDLAVSLYSGQAPMTVLLQQSGQLVDLLNLSGVEATKFGDILRTSFYSMVPAIKQVAIGIAGLVGGLFLDAGSAVTRFVANITGVSKAMEITKRAIVSGGEENFKYIASLEKIGKVASTVVAVNIAGLIAALIALALEYKKIIQAEAELSSALALSGGALGITKDQAVATAESMSALGIGTIKAITAITEIAKAGNIGKDSLELVTKAAVDLEKVAGVSIEETAKQYAKLQTEPAKALTEIAQKTGLVEKETLAYVYSLEQQGNLTEAARVATIALGSAHAQVSSEIKDNWSPVESLWYDIKSAIGNVKQEIYELATSNEVVGAMRTVWETVAVVISEVWFTIKGVGKEIGGIAAQIAAVLSGPGGFARAASIGEQMKIDAANAAAEQKKFVASILDRSAAEQKSFNQSKEQNSQYAKWRKDNDQALDKSISKEEKYKAKQLELQKAVLAGTVSQTEADKALAGWKKIIMGDGKGPANLDPNNIAKAQLASDLSSIKSSADAQVKAYADGQKIMEALRSAGLVNERDYYESKKQFVTLENQTKEDALQQEINRLSQEKLIGKDKIDNAKKIAEAQAKLDKVKAESANSLTILSIQEDGAGKKLAQYYLDAIDSANAYIDTIRKAQSLDLSGVGLGNKERSRLSGRAQIEDKYSQQRQALDKTKRNAEFNGTFGADAKAKYDNELKLIASFRATALSEYDTYYSERMKQEGDWTNGASEAYANYQAEIKNVAKSTEDLFSKAFKGMEDALVSFVKTGKLDFASLADSIITDLIRIQIQQSVMPGLSAGLNAGASWVASLFNANGNAFDTSGQVQKFAKGGTFTNQIVDQPTPFKFAKGTGIMGEAGPEAIMPLTRGSDGKLGVQASGSNSGNSIIVNVIESPGNGGQQSRRTENGVDILDVFVEKVKSSIATDINRGSGAVPNAMASTYGLNRVAGAY